MSKEKQIEKVKKLRTKLKNLEDNYKSQHDNLNEFSGLIQYSMSIENRIELFENRNGMKIVVLKEEYKPGKDFDFDGDYELIYQ